jgi:hypothetical protein
MSNKNDKKNDPIDEIESLNVDDLDIEELERRIELSSAAPIDPGVYDCGTNCGANCGTNTIKVPIGL